MSRPRERVCLQDGLRLDLNRLARNGLIKRGANVGLRGITWTHSYWGEIASGLISADMSGKGEGWFRIQLGGLDQWITLLARPRHFGGRQWYFLCPVTNRLASVLWKPSGATRFCSRQTWGRQVAYQSQFNDATNRAHAGNARIKSRLIVDLDPDEWDFPPKPKWMRSATYNRFEEGFAVTRRFWITVALHLRPNCFERISFEINGGFQVSQEISIYWGKAKAPLSILIRMTHL